MGAQHTTNSYSYGGDSYRPAILTKYTIYPEPGFDFWRARIASALGLWRSGHHTSATLGHMQECFKRVPDLYATMARLPPEQLAAWRGPK